MSAQREPKFERELTMEQVKMLVLFYFLVIDHVAFCQISKCTMDVMQFLITYWFNNRFGKWSNKDYNRAVKREPHRLGHGRKQHSWALCWFRIDPHCLLSCVYTSFSEERQLVTHCHLSMVKEGSLLQFSAFFNVFLTACQ
jgi:hypothetical protein